MGQLGSGGDGEADLASSAVTLSQAQEESGPSQRPAFFWGHAALMPTSSLGEALRAAILGTAVPRARVRYAIRAGLSAPHPAVPPRLAALLWGDLREGFSREALLRHPEARRAGDRATLTAALRVLVKAGDVRRE